MRGYKASADQGTLKTEIAGLKGKIEILEQRLTFAQEQQKAAEQEAEDFKARLAELKKKLPQDASSKELILDLKTQFDRLVAANATRSAW